MEKSSKCSKPPTSYDFPLPVLFTLPGTLSPALRLFLREIHVAAKPLVALAISATLNRVGYKRMMDHMPQRVFVTRAQGASRIK